MAINLALLYSSRRNFKRKTYQLSGDVNDRLFEELLRGARKKKGGNLIAGAVVVRWYIRDVHDITVYHMFRHYFYRTLVPMSSFCPLFLCDF